MVSGKAQSDGRRSNSADASSLQLGTGQEPRPPMRRSDGVSGTSSNHRDLGCADDSKSVLRCSVQLQKPSGLMKAHESAKI